MPRLIMIQILYWMRKNMFIFLTLAKGFCALWLLASVLGLPSRWALAQAVDFKTYLEGAHAEISRHKEIIRENPSDAIAYFELGRAYLAMGRHEEEVAAYQEAIKLNPEYTAAHYNLSMAYDLLNDGPNAIKHMLQTQNLYLEKRNHARVRKTQRQLNLLYLKYQNKMMAPKN